jgi:hypothetical protein
MRTQPGLPYNGCCTYDEQSSEIAISLLGDVAKPFLATRRVLPRHKSDPCCKIPTGFEATRVCDSGSDGRGPDHAYRGPGGGGHLEIVAGSVAPHNEQDGLNGVTNEATNTGRRAHGDGAPEGNT